MKSLLSRLVQKIAPAELTVTREMVMRLGTVAILLFAQAIPITFIQNALPAIYRAEGMELEDFWLFALLFVPRWIKWLIGPIADRYPLLPIGLRRSWILVFTLLGASGYLSLVLIEPTLANIYYVVALLVIAEFLMAVQDVAVDSYTVEAVRGDESKIAGPILGIATTLSFTVATGVIMVLYDYVGWTFAIAILSLFLVLGTVPALLRPEPIDEQARRRTHKLYGAPNFRRAFTRETGLYLFLLVLMAALYQGFGFVLLNPLLVDKGFTIAEIGIATGSGITLGLLLGGVVCTWLMARYSIKANCCIAALGIVFAGAIELSFALLSDYPLLYVIVGVAVFEFVLSPHWSIVSSARYRWTSKRQAGTDYTMQSSLRAFGLFSGGLVAGPFGGTFGYAAYFAATHILGLLATFTMFAIHDRMEQTRSRELAEDQIHDDHDSGANTNVQ